ncbi:hypothetical protein [Streptomyces sp. WM6386]|uniref:hypothetical protein n=1 Tax=Streptomyces sp. WM6386 TaxID=1415558 RepID=UPI000619F624|nr:hypothetical protein [Streptomyces sp. WM6386]KKD08306.1 hypothetical protein TN53_08695 [Streptomyces sp. WM6386]
MRSHLRSYDGRGHPRPHRPAALATGAATLVAALLATGCQATTTKAAPETAPEKAEAFTTVRFTLGPRGGVQFHGASREAVTAAGTYAVSAGRAHPFARPGGRLLVVLRHWPEARTERASRGRAPRRLVPPEEAAVETGFLVDTADWVRADLDGHPLQWLRDDTIRVDTTNGTVGDLSSLTLSGPHGGRSGQPVPPPGDPGCEKPSRLVLPSVEPGASVTAVLTRLRARCLDVQYATLPGKGTPGTVQRVYVPLAGHPVAAAFLPPLEGTTAPGRMPGDKVLTDASRPTTVVVTR